MIQGFGLCLNSLIQGRDLHMRRHTFEKVKSATSGCWKNWVRKKSSITICAWRVPHRYWTTITDGISEPYGIYDSTLTFLSYLQITRNMVSTTVKNAAFIAAIAPYQYVLVTKCIWKASISAANWYQNMLHLFNSSLSSNLSSVCLTSFLLIPDCSLSLWYCNGFEAWVYTPFTPSRAFHN